MRKFFKLMMSVVAMAAMVGCATDVTEDLGVKVGGKTQLTLSLDDTRTLLGEAENGSYPLTWAEGDQISVNGVSSYALEKNDEGATSATFSFSQSIKAPYFIAYPAAKADEQVEFPAEQSYNANAAINNGVTVMYGYSADGEGIKLSHLSGLLKLSVTGSTTLKAVRISTVDRKPIAGTFDAKYDVDKETLALTPAEGATSSVINYSFGAGLALSQTATVFYVAVPAGTYDELFVTLEDNAGKAMFRTVKAIINDKGEDKTLKAGKVREFTALEFVAEDADAKFIISDNTSFNTFIEAVKAATEEAPVTKEALFVNDITVPAGWQSVNAQYYTGTINGNGFAIKNLDAPLFNTLGASVKGLHLENVAIETTTTAANYGTLVNTYYGSSISNCSTEGTLNIAVTSDASKFVGGLIGQTMMAVTLSNLVSDVDITTSGEFYQLTLGGMIGSTGSSGNAVATTATNLTNKGTLKVQDTKFACDARTTNNNFGGIAGYSYGTLNASNLTNEGAIQIVNTTKPASYELGKLNLGGILGLYGSVVTAENWHNKGAILMQNIHLSCSYFNVGGIISYNGQANSSFTNLTNEGNITFFNATLTRADSHLDIGGIFGTATKTTNVDGNITNKGDILCYNVTKKGSDPYPGFGGIIGLSDPSGNERFVFKDTAVLNNSGDVKVYGGKYYGSIGIAGIVGCNKSISNIKNATNTGDIISATTFDGDKKAFVGGIEGGTWEKMVSNCKSYCNVAAFIWDGKADSTPTVDTTASVGILSSNNYVEANISNCQVGGGYFKSATVVTNEDGSLDLNVTYDTVTSSNFFQYISANSNPTSAPGDSVCKYWDGK